MPLIIFLEVVWNSTKQDSQHTRMDDSLRPDISFIIHHSKPTYFRHTPLYEEEMKLGCRLGLDSWADTVCSGKHAYVDEFIEGKSVNVTGFTSTLGSIDNLIIYHVLH